MGGVIKKVTGSLGLTADPNAGSGAMKMSNELQARAVRELEKLGVPSIEAQRVVLEEPELVLSTLEEKLGPSAMEEIQLDPRLQETQMQALASLQELGEKGFGAEDRAAIEAMRDQAVGDEQARQASILQSMAQRGMGGSGAELASRLSSSQGAAEQARRQGLELASQQAAARRGAMAQAGQLSGQMGQQQFSQRAQQASAKDRISAFNAAVAQRDTGARQAHSQQKANLANQQQMYNKGLIQQNFQNQLAKATGMTGAIGNQAQAAAQQAAMQAHAAQQEAAGMRQIGQAGGQALMSMSDERVKKNVEPANPNELHEMLDKANPYKFEYKDSEHGQGEHFGLMAQDLEKSQAGDQFVKETPEGKAVDYGQMTGALAAGVSDLNKRLKKMEDKEGKKYQMGGIGGQFDPLAGMASQAPANQPLTPGQLGGSFSQPTPMPDAFGGMEDRRIPMQAAQATYAEQATPYDKLMEDLDSLGLKDKEANRTDAPLERGLTREKLDVINKNKETKKDYKKSDAKKEAKKEDEGSKGMDAAKAFLDGMNKPQEKVEAMQVGNLNPNDIGRALAMTQQGGSPLDAIRAKIMQGMSAEDGGVKGMNYEAGGEGTIIDSGEENFAGDELADRINDGEMVLNLDQQQRISDLLQELAQYRTDEAVEADMLEVNEAPQETLMDIARGEAEPEDLLVEEEVVEPTDELESLIAECGGVKGKKYYDGGLVPSMEELLPEVQAAQEVQEALSVDPELLPDAEEGFEDRRIPLQAAEATYSEQRDPYSELLEALDGAGLEEQPETDIPLERGMTQEKLDVAKQNQEQLAKMRALREEASEEEADPNAIVESPNAPKEMSRKPASKEKSPGDQDLEDAKQKDMIMDLLSGLDSAFAHFDAANPNAMLKPIKSDKGRSDFEDKLQKARQIAENKDYKKRQLDLQEKAMISKAQEKQERADLREKGESRRMKQAQISAARGFLKDHPQFKDAIKQGAEFESVERLLDEVEAGNQNALSALGTKLARAMGEVGVLTDADVVRYVGGQSWGRKMKDWADRGYKGTLSKDTLDEMRKNLGVLRTKLKGDTDRVYGNASRRMKTAFPEMEDGTIKGLLGAPEVKESPKKETKSEAPYGPEVERNGKKYKWNASKKKYQLIEG